MAFAGTFLFAEQEERGSSAQLLFGMRNEELGNHLLPETELCWSAIHVSLQHWKMASLISIFLTLKWFWDEMERHRRLGRHI